MSNTAKLPAPIPCVMHLGPDGELVQVTMRPDSALVAVVRRNGGQSVPARVVPDVPMPPDLVRWREEIAQRWVPGITPPEQIFQLFAYIDQLRGA